jgi:phage terminase large subunit-like protein
MVIEAAERHALAVLEALEARYRADPRFAFDRATADAACAFFPRYLRHTNGPLAGRPFDLLEWQRRLVALIFGWKWASGPLRGRRVVRQVWLEIARKNGKSTFAAGIALLLLLGDGGKGVEVYSAAADKEQAKIVFRDAVTMAVDSPDLARLVEPLKEALIAPTGVYRALSADADTKHGLRPKGVLFDEVHTQPNRHLYDVLHTAVGAQAEPLELYITTAGTDRQSICYELHYYAIRVRDGVVEDPAFLPVLFAATDTDDFADPMAWAKANPSLGQAVAFEFLEAEARRALDQPGYQNTFRRLYMNQWTEAVSAWIGADLWRRNETDLDADGADLDGRRCYGALDLSGKKDLTALPLVFPPEDGDPDGVYDVLLRFWSPGDTLAERATVDRVPYTLWRDQGHLIAPPGRSVDYAFVAEELGRLSARFDLVQVAFDPWRISDLERELEAAGVDVPLVKHGQGWQGGARPDQLWMPRSLDELERLLLAGRLRIRRNPVLTWNAASAVIEADAKGNRIFTKRKSTGRIDGIVALAMAVGAATAGLIGTDPGISLPAGYRVAVA